MNKDYFINIVEEYLIDLQGGRLGIPTLEDLQNAGLLHQFLENNEDDVEFPKYPYFFVGVAEKAIDEHSELLHQYMEDYNLNPVMKFDKPDEYVYIDADKKHVLFAFCKR